MNISIIDFWFFLKNHKKKFFIIFLLLTFFTKFAHNIYLKDRILYQGSLFIEILPKDSQLEVDQITDKYTSNEKLRSLGQNIVRDLLHGFRFRSEFINEKKKDKKYSTEELNNFYQYIIATSSNPSSTSSSFMINYKFWNDELNYNLFIDFINRVIIASQETLINYLTFSTEKFIQIKKDDYDKFINQCKEDQIEKQQLEEQLKLIEELTNKDLTLLLNIKQNLEKQLEKLTKCGQKEKILLGQIQNLKKDNENLRDIYRENLITLGFNYLKKTQLHFYIILSLVYASVMALLFFIFLICMDLKKKTK